MKVPILLVLAGLSVSAHAVEQAVTLVCQGTVKTYEWDKDTNETSVKDEPISVNIGVNFTGRKVEGFDLSGDISLMDELNVVFEGRYAQARAILHGSINRVTGDLYAEMESEDLHRWVSKTTH
jgi:hypothetical protein